MLTTDMKFTEYMYIERTTFRFMYRSKSSVFLYSLQVRNITHLYGGKIQKARVFFYSYINSPLKVTGTKGQRTNKLADLETISMFVCFLLL